MKFMTLNSFFVCLFALIALVTLGKSQIEAGTSVQITIMGVPAEEIAKVQGIYPVSESGTINLPIVNERIHAAGMSQEALATTIQNVYKARQIYTNPTIQVISTREGSGVQEQMVHIGGQVRKTGPVAYQKNLTIYQAVQAAGGATEFGSLKKVKLYRNGKTLTYDLTNPQFMRVPLEPADTLEVPEKNWLGQ